MQRALGVHFKTELFDAEQLPPGNSTRFYPEERAICNHMCNTAPKTVHVQSRLRKYFQENVDDRKIVNVVVCVCLSVGCSCFLRGKKPPLF